MSTPKSKTADPLHGVTLEQMLVALSAAIGWEALGRTIPSFFIRWRNKAAIDALSRPLRRAVRVG